REPGDLVQVDTLDLRPVPGVVLKHFTARDVVSRWDVLEVHTRATSTLAAQFLTTLQARLPFPLKAIQVDGGSEFAAVFEAACQRRGIRLFVLPPALSQAQRLRGACPAHPHGGVLRGHRLLPGYPHPQPRAACLGAHLQHRASPPGLRLPHPATVPGPVAHPTKGGPLSLIYWTSTGR
ncbi:MAG: transposase family protein, partial [SAR202 cluster bacterium]|nr:transposase family protein [SAR202 cluster bacterium]